MRRALYLLTFILLCLYPGLNCSAMVRAVTGVQQSAVTRDQTSRRAARSITVKIRLDNPPSDGMPVELLDDSDTEMSIVIPRSYRPALSIPANVQVTRTADAERIKFSFVMAPGMSTNLERKSNEIYLTFVPVDSEVTAGAGDGNGFYGSSRESVGGGVTAHHQPVVAREPAGESGASQSAATREVEGATALGAAGASSGSGTASSSGPTGSSGTTSSSGPTGQTPGATPFFGLLGMQAPINQMNLNLAVPDSPAFTVLGLTPQNVIRPSSPQALATSLLNGVDKNGNFQSGIALDTVPYLLFAGGQVTLERYRNSIPTRMLSRLEVSIASTKGASDADKSARLALGFRLTPWDHGDPRMDKALTDCIKGVMEPILATLPPIPPGPPTPEMQTLIDAALAKAKPAIVGCREQARKSNWNRSSWTIGAAPSWISPTGALGTLQWNGGGFWTSLGYGFEGIPGLEKTSQIILHARYRTRETVPDPNHAGQFFVQDSAFFGGRFRAGTPDFAFNFEGGYVHNMPIGGAVNNSYTLSFGGERRVSKDLWFEISVGGQGGVTGGKSNTFVLTSFKWDFSKEPQLGVPPR